MTSQKPERLNDAARAEALKDLSGWFHDDLSDAITRELKFRDFRQAFGFMTQVALAAEKLGHHPDWSNSYGRVVITLSTHDAGGLTEKDIALARIIDALVER